MNPPSRRSTCENAVKKEPIGPTIVAKSRPESKAPVVSYDYEAAISQPDIPVCSKLDDNPQNASWSEASDESSVPIRKTNLYARGKAVASKKRGVAFKSKVQARKVTKTRPSVSNVAEIQKESTPSSEIIRNAENYGRKISGGIIRQTLNLHQKSLPHSRDLSKTSGVAKNDGNLANEAVGVFQENSDKILIKREDTRSCIPRNKSSKIPRIKLPIKPNTFLPMYEESRIHPNAELSVRAELKRSTDMKSSVDSEEKRLIFEETLNCEKLKIKNTLSTVRENPNLWCPEKSSEMDADEEFEGDLPTPKGSPIVTGAGDDPRSATLLKSLALKCECRSCNDHKYASAVRTDQHTETESWSSLEIGSARKWKSTRSKFVSSDVSSEDLDTSDYNVINYDKINGKINKKNGSNLASHITKLSSTVNHARMKTYRTTNFSFFNVFFDIVFWPFVFLRAKQ